MANDNNIQHFTALDIEKYHKGLLSPSQMNAMEKAALEDEFLADAMEGYSVAGVNVAADFAELKKRFTEKKQEAKVIPLNQERRNNFKILRAAVVVAFVAGAAFLAFQFVGNKKSENIAQLKVPKEEIVKAKDATVSVTDSSAPTIQKNIATPVTTNTNTVNSNVNSSADETKSVSGGTSIIQDQIAKGNASVPAPVIVETPAAVAEAEKISAQQEDIAKRQLAKAKVANTNASVPVKKEADLKNVEVSQDITDKDLANNRSVALDRKADDQGFFKAQQQSNTFRGRVTDAHNVGLPFANVTNPQDNVGTYTDARGNFNLTYPDSVLNVQVRSLGFADNTVQLRGSVANTQIVMQDDKSLNEVVINSQKPNAAARSKESNIKMEESEPSDGWDNYDTYLSNNLNVPEEFKTKQNSGSAVQVSFEVDKNGDPTNIKVEKSLCSSCDKEAIRLVKEGPKWKRMAAKKGRTTVTIKF